MVLVDAGHTGRLLWRDLQSFIELKSLRADGPYRERTGEGVKDITAQVGDYARLRMSLYPFQAFIICIALCADMFTVIVFDRGGALYSPQMEMYEDGRITDVFIRVIRALTCSLDVYELGLDRTISLGLPKEPPSPKSTEPEPSPEVPLT